MSADLTVPPLPVVARLNSAIQLEWCIPDEATYSLAGDELVTKTDADAAIASLQARLEAAERDVARLDSRRILIRSRNEFGEPVETEHRSIDLRAAIDAANKD